MPGSRGDRGAEARMDGSLPPNPQGNRNGSEMRGAVVCAITSHLTGTVWGTEKRVETSAADAHVTNRVGWPRSRAGQAWCVCVCVEVVVVGLWGAPGGKIPGGARFYARHLEIRPELLGCALVSQLRVTAAYWLRGVPCSGSVRQFACSGRVGLILGRGPSVECNGGARWVRR